VSLTEREERMTPLYFFVSSLIRAILRLFFRFTIEGKENLPSSGAFLVAANHVSYLDPPVVGVLFGRQVHFMAKSELFEIAWLGPLLRRLGSFPVVRESADTKSVKHAIALLKEGKIVGIFPEGRRSTSGEMLEGELGMALLTKQAKVPLIPCALIGTFHPVKFRGIIPLFAKIRARIGKPLFYDEAEEGSSKKDKMKNFTLLVMNELKCLMNEQSRCPGE
jgi:1-acyl-sn-glycerol-3-phosphate acyltransferase